MRGVSRARLRAADLTTPFWGVRVRADAPLSSVAERCRAFQPRMPAGAAFSHLTAAALYGAPLASQRDIGALHIATPRARRPVDARRIVGHRMTLRPGDVGIVEGLPITSPERTWLDLAPILSRVELVALGDYLIGRSGLTSMDALCRAFRNYAGRRGRILIRDVLPRLDPGAESPRESQLRLLLADLGLPPFEANVVITDADGRFLARCDLVDREHMLILEYEGDQHRTDRRQWQRDVARTRALEAAGWRVIRVTARDLAYPEPLVADIRRHLARARRIPRTRLSPPERRPTHP